MDRVVPGDTVIYRGYPERDLVSNRSSLLLYGSSEAERRAWAEEASSNFEAEGALTVVTGDVELREVLSQPGGVIYIPDVSALSDAAQSEIVRTLRLRDERPKVIVGVMGTPDTAREQGRLRADLQYALQMAQVNLDEPELKDAIRARRARAPNLQARSLSSTSASKAARRAASSGKSAESHKASKKRAASRSPARRRR